MRIAHLILAHKAPAQLARLVRALAHPQAEVFIHLDRKTDLAPFAALAELPGVQFVPRRFNVTWGGHQFAEAILETQRTAMQAPGSFDYFNLMSGEDYPIKPVADFHAFLAQQGGQSFVQYHREGAPWWQANGRRVSEYHLTDFHFPGRYAVQKVLNRVLPARKFPELPTLYGGEMGGWYTLSRACLAYLLNYVDAHAAVWNFGRFSWGSDEYLVPTILLNSPLAPAITNDNLRYIDWSGGGANPKILTTADLPALQASPKFFARKFDSTRDAEVLKRLDDLHGRQPQSIAVPAR